MCDNYFAVMIYGMSRITTAIISQYNILKTGFGKVMGHFPFAGIAMLAVYDNIYALNSHVSLYDICLVLGPNHPSG